jgi:hypothetical protein
MTPVRARAPLLHLRCADVLPVLCDASWHLPRQEDLVARAHAHGGTAHGYTPVWYSAERLAAMAQAVTY